MPGSLTCYSSNFGILFLFWSDLYWLLITLTNFFYCFAFYLVYFDCSNVVCRQRERVFARSLSATGATCDGLCLTLQRRRTTRLRVPWLTTWCPLWCSPPTPPLSPILLTVYRRQRPSPTVTPHPRHTVSLSTSATVEVVMAVERVVVQRLAMGEEREVIGYVPPPSQRPPPNQGGRHRTPEREMGKGALYPLRCTTDARSSSSDVNAKPLGHWLS